MKRKIIGIIGCIAFAWAGLAVTVLALTEETPAKQGWLTIGAAALILTAIVFAGYGNSKEAN